MSLNPTPEDARHVCEMYGLSERDWQRLVDDEWRNVCAQVRPEFIAPGRVPQSFHLLPVFRAHALYSPSVNRRQAANYARADILEPYFSNDE